MKKVFAVMAVLAVAAVAQAELLNTWSFASGGQSSNEKNTGASNIGQVTFGDLTRAENMGQSGSGAFFAANNWSNDRGLSFTIDVAPDYEITGSKLSVGALNGTQGAPNQLQWKLDGTAVGTAWSLSTSSADSTAGTVDVGLIDDSKQHTVALTYTQPGRINSATANADSGGNVRLWTKLELDGTIQQASGPTPAVPEPATMSLLGLGALAMALRRKLRK